MQKLSLIQEIAVWTLPVLLAVTVHEAAHGWMASKLGDPTALYLGRVTLNPLNHIDPFGTIVMPLSLLAIGYFTGGIFLFGWAKPVPIDFNRLRRLDIAVVAVAGPLANLLMAILWGLVAKAASYSGESSISLPLLFMGTAGIIINSMMLVINMLPMLPLDGGRILSSLIPVSLAIQFQKTEPYGLLVLLVLLATGLFSLLIAPVITLQQQAIFAILGL